MISNTLSFCEVQTKNKCLAHNAAGLCRSKVAKIYISMTLDPVDLQGKIFTLTHKTYHEYFLIKHFEIIRWHIGSQHFKIRIKYDYSWSIQTMVVGASRKVWGTAKLLSKIGKKNYMPSPSKCSLQLSASFPVANFCCFQFCFRIRVKYSRHTFGPKRGGHDHPFLHL